MKKDETKRTETKETGRPQPFLCKTAWRQPFLAPVKYFQPPSLPRSVAVSFHQVRFYNLPPVVCGGTLWSGGIALIDHASPLTMALWG